MRPSGHFYRLEETYFIMDSDSLRDILIMAVLILMSAYFSATETAFSSLNKTRLKTRAEKGSRRAAATLKLAEDYDKLLSTILIGNNIVNIATASIGTLLFVRHYGDLGATLSTIVVTIVVLIFGEITPKSLAKDSPERFAMFSTPFLRALVILLTPINWLFTQWKKLVSMIFRVKEDRRLTQDELLVLVDEVAQDGGIDEDEHRRRRIRAPAQRHRVHRPRRRGHPHPPGGPGGRPQHRLQGGGGRGFLHLPLLPDSGL